MPDGTPTDKPVAEGQLEVPETGVYQLHCGSGESSFNAMELDGKEVYRREAGGEPVKQDVTLEPGKRYAFKISGFTGRRRRGSGCRRWTCWATATSRPWPSAKASSRGWSTTRATGRAQRRLTSRRRALAEDGKGSPLSATSNGKTIGPELGFGHVMGTFHDEQVLLIKTAHGQPLAGLRFPPAVERPQPTPTTSGKSLEYKLMVEGVRKTLDKIDKIVPGYKGQGYEIAGFVWWQGHKDSGRRGGRSRSTRRTSST